MTKVRCSLTAKLLSYLYENPEQSAIVGPYPNERRITTAVLAFNRARFRPYAVRVSQRKVLVVDPVTAMTETMWEVRVIEKVNKRSI